MSKSLDSYLGIAWIKYAIFFALIMVAAFGLYQCDSGRLKTAGDAAVSVVENGTLEGNIEDAKNLNKQNTAINAAPSLIDSLLPKAAHSGGKDRQNSIAERNTSDAAANIENIRRLEGNYRVGVEIELPVEDLLQSAVVELLPKCRLRSLFDADGNALKDSDGFIKFVETCE